MFSFIVAFFTIFVALFAVCASSFTIRDLDCPPNGVARCMAIVQRSTDESRFCQDAQQTLSCVNRVLRSCFTRDDSGFLDALATYDITGLYQRMITMC